MRTLLAAACGGIPLWGLYARHGMQGLWVSQRWELTSPVLSATSLQAVHVRGASVLALALARFRVLNTVLLTHVPPLLLEIVR